MIYAFFQSWNHLLANKRLLLPLYLANLLMAGIAMLPLLLSVQGFAGESLLPASLPTGLDSTLMVTDYAFHEEVALNTSMNFMLIGAFIYLMVQVFLSGGILNCLYQGEGYSFETFWGGAGTWFGPFFRLFLWAAPLFIIAFLPALVIQFAADAIFGPNQREPLAFKITIFQAISVAFSLFLAARAFDYARIDLINANCRKTRRAIWNGIRFVATKPLHTSALGLLFTVPAIIITMGHTNFRIMVDTTAVLFISGQLYIIVRLMLRISMFAAELTFFQSFYPAPVEVVEPETPASVIKGYTFDADEFDEDEKDTDPVIPTTQEAPAEKETKN